MRSTLVSASLLIGSLATVTVAGQYSGPMDTEHAIDPAIPASSADFVEWADSILPLGAGTYFAPRGSSEVSPTEFNSLGDLDEVELASGDRAGYLTVTFPTGIGNDQGADFAVFENGFVLGSPNDLFMELAYVEVSSNGSDFARFPSSSLNEGPSMGSGAFAAYDSTNVYNLAGKHAEGYGTPFDLDDLVEHPLVRNGTVMLDNVQYVRLVDIPGNGRFLDSEGNPIFDSWLTNDTGGFDFRLPEQQGIGVLHLAAFMSTADFDQNGVLDAADIDLISAAIRSSSNDFVYDLDDSGAVNQADHSHLIRDELNTWFGDANLDREFDSSDIVQAFAAGKYELDVSAGWADGDWNGNGLFNSGDLVTAFTDGGYEQGARSATTPVPEPTSVMLPIIGALVVANFLRRLIPNHAEYLTLAQTEMPC